MLYAICGLSGSGKTTLLEAALRQAPSLARLVTFTTRPPRPDEVPGRAYHFLTEEAFQARVASGALVCPIQYRGFSYATAQADLSACARRATLAVLLPDTLACLAVYTPILGIYLEMVGRETPTAEEDQVIFAHRHCCHYRVANIPGHLDWAVATLLGILRKYDQEELSHGRSGLRHPHPA
jgi:ribose 1,5-bisphosphokinase PhnN